MTGLLLSILAFVVVLVLVQRSVGAGMAALLVFGYFYGIVRANFLDGFTHFIFDAAVLGLYLGHFGKVGLRAPRKVTELFRWTIALVAWPFVVFALGIFFPQHMLIQLVGLRAAVWYLPVMLVGARAGLVDLRVIARTVGILNVIVLGFALAEFVLGIQAFYPINAATELMYRSNDVAGYTAHRIPATFVSAAGYGTTMALTIPWLAGLWLEGREHYLEKGLLVAALLATVVGVFLCASRMPVVLLLVQGLVVVHHLRVRLNYLLPAALVIGVAVYLVAGNERLQRFTSLQDTARVTERIEGSVNLGLVDLFLNYPMGAGLGSAFGTSIPNFLQHLVTQKPLGAESEFARIGLEQSLIGLLLWVGFLAWLLTHQRPRWAGGWQLGEKLTWLCVLFSWGTASLGCGTLMSIPGTCMLLFQMGMLGRSLSPVSFGAVRLLEMPTGGEVSVETKGA